MCVDASNHRARSLLWRRRAVQSDSAAAALGHAGGPGAPSAGQSDRSCALQAGRQSAPIRGTWPRARAWQRSGLRLCAVQHKILVVIEPLLIDEDYYARCEGREIISNLAKAAGLATMIATMRPYVLR